MKNTRLVSLLLILCMLLTLCACAKDEGELWANALYTEDTELGEGSKTVSVSVQAGEKSVVFTIHSDCATLGEALSEHALIAGDMGEFGLYVKSVNGIAADYDADKSYWGFYRGGEYMLSGVDMTELADGDKYELIREK